MQYMSVRPTHSQGQRKAVVNKAAGPSRGSQSLSDASYKVWNVPPPGLQRQLCMQIAHGRRGKRGEVNLWHI